MNVSYALEEAHFCRLPSCCTVYSLAKICLPGNVYKVLVASMHGKLVFIEHNLTHKARSREIQFTYIPGDAEIISIDSFTKSQQCTGVVVGITFIKNSNSKPTQFLNIYSDGRESESDFSLDNIAQGCLNLELPFVPFQLYHTDMYADGSKEIVFLLSGDDQKVHMFREDKNSHSFNEQEIETYFPEFTELPGNVMWMDIKYIENNRKRLTAIGCQNGYVLLFIVDSERSEVIDSWLIRHDSIITAIKIFTMQTGVECPPFVQSGSEGSDVDENLDDNEDRTDRTEYHLLVAGALEPVVVYRNITENGLTLNHQIILKGSDAYDSVFCACVTDLDFDGQNEMILGTYGQELLVYKYFPPPTEESETSDSSKSVSGSARLGEYKLVWTRSFADPLLALDKMDLTNDGMEEVLVVSMRGVHLLQHNPDDVAKLCYNRLLKMTKRKEDIFELLQKENLENEESS